jgi:SRSO17 transposase
MSVPAKVSLKRLATLAHSRWAIEQFYEDSNGECGLDDFQGRRWDGLHRHLALVMLTYSFLMQQRLPSPTTGGEGLFPLKGGPELPGRSPAGVAWAVPGLGALVDRH